MEGNHREKKIVYTYSERRATTDKHTHMHTQSIWPVVYVRKGGTSTVGMSHFNTNMTQSHLLPEDSSLFFE